MISAILAPLYKYITGGLLFVSLVLGIALAVERRHSNKLEQRNVELTAKLEAISTAKNEQKAETAERIKVVTRTIHDADGKAKVIENAPLPGNCKTPVEVSQADL